MPVLAARSSRKDDSTAGMKAALLVSPFSEDHRQLSMIFFDQGWTLFHSGTIGSALTVLRDRRIPVVITEPNLPLGNWKDLLESTRQLDHAPLLVVASRVADEYLWAEVLNLGGHDVLAKPFQAMEVCWVLESAWRIRTNRSPQTGEPGRALSAAR